MCGEDGTQRVVYKLREEHAQREDRNKKRKERKAQTEEGERKKQKNCIDYQKETIVVPALSLQYT